MNTNTTETSPTETSPDDARGLFAFAIRPDHAMRDAETIAKFFVPDSPADSSSAEWMRYAQSLMSCLIFRCWQRGLPGSQLLRLVQQADVQELQQALDGLPGAARLAGDERMLATVRGIVSTHAAGPLSLLC